MGRGRPKKIISEKLIEERQKDKVLEENKFNERREKLERIIKETNREFGNTVLKFASSEPDKQKILFGIKEIDNFTGGAICGNFIIIYGSEGVGKTTLILQQIANAQKLGKICAYIDMEHSFNKERAGKLGINLDDLLLIEEVDTAEQAMDLTIKLAQQKVVDYIVIDSIQAMSPSQEQMTKKGKLKSMEEDEMALLARKMGKFLRVCATPIYKGNVAVILIGQVRTEGIGSFITREGLTSGHATKHFSQLTIYMRKGQGADSPCEKVEIDKVDEKGKPVKEDRKIGFDCVLKIEKTKTNSKPEGSTLHIPFYFAGGFK